MYLERVSEAVYTTNWLQEVVIMNIMLSTSLEIKHALGYRLSDEDSY